MAICCSINGNEYALAIPTLRIWSNSDAKNL
jgi:hypothetical protein